MKNPPSAFNGVLSIHKPKGPTSHDIVARVRRLAGTRRVGHCGTLDPMAEGVLVCCLGTATRAVPWLTGLPKEYTGEITLGASSNTYDAEGEITLGPPAATEKNGESPEIFHQDDPRLEEACRERCANVTLEALSETFRSQTGAIDQAAPAYSAIKVKGKRLYEYARRGLDVPEKIRRVWVERFDPVRFLPPKITFFSRVGSGTYIRSLAHDSGVALGCGAYLSRLTRVSVAHFHIDQATPLELLEADPEGALPNAMLSIAEGLGHLPKLVLTPEAETRLRQGGTVGLEGVLESHGPQPVGEPTLALSSQGSGQVIAVVQCDAPDLPYRSLRVFTAV